MNENRRKSDGAGTMDFQALRDHQRNRMRWTLVPAFLNVGALIAFLAFYISN